MLELEKRSKNIRQVKIGYPTFHEFLKSHLIFEAKILIPSDVVIDV